MTTTIRINISVNKISEDEFKKLDKWLEENLHNSVVVMSNITSTPCYDLDFENSEDALMFKMRFGYAIHSDN